MMPKLSLPGNSQNLADLFFPHFLPCHKFMEEKQTNELLTFYGNARQNMRPIFWAPFKNKLQENSKSDIILYFRFWVKSSIIV